LSTKGHDSPLHQVSPPLDSICGFEFDTVVGNWKADLMFEIDAVRRQLMARACVIEALKAASSQGRMDFESRGQNAFRDRSVQAQLIPSVSSVVASFPVQGLVR
jgi:hypothetical protein